MSEAEPGGAGGRPQSAVPREAARAAAARRTAAARRIAGARQTAAPRKQLRRRRATAIATVVVVALGASFAALAGCGGGSGGQTQKKAMWALSTLPNGASPYPTMRDLGVGIAEQQIHWYDVATKRPRNPTDPNDPAYHWPATLSANVSEAKRYGMETSIMLIGAPPWANGGKPWYWVPKNPADFGRFATAAAKKYPDVHLWMIWGEPNRAPNFQPMTPPTNRTTLNLTPAEQVAPHNYAQLVDAAYGGVTSVDPSNKVIAGDTYTTAGPGATYTYQWMKYMRLPNGQPPRFDLWGHNPYGFRKPMLSKEPSKRGIVAFQDLQRLEQALDQNFPGRNMKLFLAEWGVPVQSKDLDLGYSVPVNAAKKWIQAGFGIARDDPRIFTLGWVHLADIARTSQGLLTASGVRKPTYDVYKGS